MTLLRATEPKAAIFLLNSQSAKELSKKRLQSLSRLALVFGLLLVFGTVFASLEAMEICSASIKANFCP
jgi:hypothetical protein